MATLNDVEFGILKQTTTVIHDNNVIDIPGSDTVVNDDAGYSSGPMQITGHVKNESEFDDFKGEFYSGGELILIADPDSEKQYTVYASGNVTELDGDDTYPLSDIVFQCSFFMKYPYLESVAEVTRAKTITTNNQEWSADDSANDIDTDGSVDAVPDIQVIGGIKYESFTQTTVDTIYNMNAGAAPVSITQSLSKATGDCSTVNTIGQTINCRTAGMMIIDSFQIDVDTVTTGGTFTCTVYDKYGGSSLGSVDLAISGTGLKTFTFSTPIAVATDNTTCTGTEIIYIEISTSDGDIGVKYYFFPPDTDPYTYGRAYGGGGLGAGTDLKFVLTGHSVKEIHQTFQLTNAASLISVIIKGCDYNYSGSNVWTAKIYESTTLLGTGTTSTPGASFAEIEFFFEEETTNSLHLSGVTEYTIKLYPPSDSVNATSVLILANASSVYADGAVTLIENGGTSRAQTHDIYFKINAEQICINPEIYNTADTSVKCGIGNRILNEAIHQINVDGTGTIDYDDNFSTDKYLTDSQKNVNVVWTSPAYSSDLTSGTTATASEYDVSYPPSKTIDNLTNTSWRTTVAPADQWLKIDFGAGNETQIQRARLMNFVDYGYNSFRIQASNDDSTWTTLKTDTCANNGDWQTFSFTNNTRYRYYRVYAVSGYGDKLIFMEIELMTYDGYLSIADDGYIYYKIDTKYPITEIPTLTSQINITTGTPTIQIAADSGGSPDTWYDIDTAIVDDVDTEYPLDSDGNLSLAGKTLFYFRFDCVKAAAATCYIKSFELDINIHTIYAKNPVINRGAAANTFRCDQDADSGMNCEVSLIYPAKWWA